MALAPAQICRRACVSAEHGADTRDFRTFGPDLIMFGLFGVFIFLRPAWRTQRAREQSEARGG